MEIDKYFKEILNQTEVIKTPAHRLSTFGETRIRYFILSEIPKFMDRSRLRSGIVIAEKPKILTADFFKNRFEGFGKESDPFHRWISNLYGERFQGLEYKYRNENVETQIEHSSLDELSQKLRKRLEKQNVAQSVILRGPDKAWQISLMKFIVDECLASFSTNMRDLSEHGFFDDPDDVKKKQRKIVEELILKAKCDPSYIKRLGEKLSEFNLFKDYEDVFFSLLHS